MGKRTIARTFFGTTVGAFCISLFGTSCSGKKHVDVDLLGDAAPCGGCSTGEVCLLGGCLTTCQQDHECSIGERCLRTTQGGGCVSVTQATCTSSCSAGGTVCRDGECRTDCSFGCASDQLCRSGSGCFGDDTSHDPSGGFGTSSTGSVVTSNASGTAGPVGVGSSSSTGTAGAGGSFGAGGGGQGGGTGGNFCGNLSDPCGHCMCLACPGEWQACNADPGCLAIGDCIRRNNCRNNCYQPSFCQGVIDSNGGPSGASYNRVLSLGSCSMSSCQTTCGGGGSGATDVGYWRFDEGGGTMANDSSGSGHAATIVNAPPWSPGITGSSISLDGATQFAVVTPGPIVGSSSAFTIEAWINWMGGPAQQAVYAEAGNVDVIEIYLDGGFPRFMTLSGNSLQIATSPRNVPLGNWHHLAGVLEPGVGGTLYLDGQIASSNPSMGPAAPGSIFETDIGRSHAAGGSRYFHGLIDEVHVFMGARSSMEIMTDYKSALNGAP